MSTHEAGQQATTADELNALFDAYGNAGGQWTGGDGTTSVALPDGRVVWLFASTFLGSVAPDHTRPTHSPMVHNSMVVQDGTRLVRTLRGGTALEPTAYVTPRTGDGEFCWPADGIVEGGALTILYRRMRLGRDGAPDVESTGTTLVTVDLPSLAVASVVDLPLGPTIGWGSALLPDGPHTYVYGTSSAPGRMRFAHLARAGAGALDGPWEFWTGSGWSDDATDAGTLLSGVGPTYSVQRIGDRYVLVTHETNLLFDARIAGYTAPAPTGPFTGPHYVHTAPEVRPGGRTVVYGVRSHPELATDGTLLLSYDVNSLDHADRLADVRLCRPRFVEVDWPLPSPPVLGCPPPSSPGTPAAPVGLTATGQDDTARLTWTAVAGAASYRVHQRDVTGGQTHFAQLPGEVAATSLTAGLLIAGHRYEFAVSAVDTAGEGPPSAVASVTPHSTRPVTDVIGYAGSPQAIPGSYLVSLRTGAVSMENLDHFSRQLLAQYGGRLDRLLPFTLHGFSAELTEAQARDLAAHPDVAAIEQDVTVSLDSLD